MTHGDGEKVDVDRCPASAKPVAAVGTGLINLSNPVGGRRWDGGWDWVAARCPVSGLERATLGDPMMSSTGLRLPLRTRCTPGPLTPGSLRGPTPGGDG